MLDAKTSDDYIHHQQSLNRQDRRKGTMEQRLHTPYAVYGTLRSGMGNDGLWRGLAEPISAGVVRGFRLVSNESFPYALPAGADSEIVVEVIQPYEQYAEIVRRNLDRLEGYPSFYDRILVDVENDRGHATCWLYTPVDPERYEDLRPVHSNDWRAHVIKAQRVVA
jgi:gamma-glutamylcyclotransferase (GGCT)/AIG2-like uncharacterized protein YtfP